MKKYLIRIIGALCILGSVALMFMPGWLELKGISRRDLRDIRSDVDGICTTVTDRMVALVEMDDDFKDELKDCDLPYTKGKIKARLREIGDLAEELLNETISLQELLILACKAPGILEDAENLLDSDAAEILFTDVAKYILYEGSQAEYSPYDGYNWKLIDTNAEHFMNSAEDVLDGLSVFMFVFILLTSVLILIIALAVISAVTHICNKGRWLKYLYFVLLLGLVVGTCVALPAVSELLAEPLETMPAFEDMTINIMFTPFVAVALMIVPIILDIIFERKKKQ